MISYIELAERMKLEIVEDVRAQVVPTSVSSFSELHDFVDANCYGGMEALLDELDAAGPNTDAGHRAALDAVCDLANPAQDLVDAWIKSGGVRDAAVMGDEENRPAGA